MSKVVNPILRGFNPDPSIVRVGDDYYIATSTFEWFPGVQIHHSQDLVNWELITHALKDTKWLDMKGVPDSCGVWAPCLTHDGEKFYLVYSNCKSFDGVWKDTPNYLITAENIHGPWSEPIFLGSYGFDGSLFHDEDGRKWFLSLLVDHRKGKFFGGIILREYDVRRKRLVGPVHHIFEGTELGITEGPHLYKINGYYYLITAEGGTEYDHAVTIARSERITGPYEVHPNNPLISTAKHPNHPLQKTGHGDIVFSEDGRCFIVYLTSRPLTKRGRCILGRETGIEELIWKEDGWPYLKMGGCLPRIELETYSAATNKSTSQEYIDFSKDELSIHYASLRVPLSRDWIHYNRDKGKLILKGRESLSSTHLQSLLARRVQHFNVTYVACLDFEPSSFQHMMGVVLYYNTGHYYYLHIYGSEQNDRRFLQIIKCDKFEYSECLPQPISLHPGSIFLKLALDRDNVSFLYGYEQNQMIDLGISEDASIISDDYAQYEGHRYRPAFTGSFVGVACQDLTGLGYEGSLLSVHYREH